MEPGSHSGRVLGDAEHAQVLLNALELEDAGYDFPGTKQRLHALRRIGILGNKNLVRIGELLHARRDVDGLAEIIEPFVQCHRNRRALVDPDLENERTVGLPGVETIDLMAHRKRGSDRVGGSRNVAMTASPMVLMIAPWCGPDVLQQIEMPLHQGEG